MMELLVLHKINDVKQINKEENMGSKTKLTAIKEDVK